MKADKKKGSLQEGPFRKAPIKTPPHVILMYVAIALGFLLLWRTVSERLAVREIPYSEFRKRLAKAEIVRVQISPDAIIGEAIESVEGGSQSIPSASSARARKTFTFRTIPVEDPDLVKDLLNANVEFTGARPDWLSQLVVGWIIPLGFLILIFMIFLRTFRPSSESILSFGRSRAKLIADRSTGVTFDDVAGCDEAKEELKEVVEFLRDPKIYQELGARIPKGVLLVGPPGTGKTLLARAVAGEAKVPFFSISGSDFVEMFVGVGAARVRDLFNQAKQHAPCIVFIDELDAIGRQRGVHISPGNDEREQTLNALLVEMDGFEPNAGIIVLAATNRPEILDRALLRPGRFDRHVIVDLPDVEGRLAILKVHARNKKLAQDVDLRKIAAATPGFSGADLANVLNEAALLAARRRAREITQEDLLKAIEKVIAGPERRSRRINPDEKRRVAYHEVGHALVSAFTEHGEPVQKLSVIPRGRAVLGYTLQMPTEDQYIMTRAELLDKIRSLLGGRAAEEIVFGDISTGAQNDLERATILARQMVAMYGMSDRVGLVSCVQQRSIFLGGDFSQYQLDCSDQTAREIDEEVKHILNSCYTEAKELLTRHVDRLHRVATELLVRETLDGQTFYQLIGKPIQGQASAPSTNPESCTNVDLKGNTNV